MPAWPFLFAADIATLYLMAALVAILPVGIAADFGWNLEAEETPTWALMATGFETTEVVKRDC